MRIEVVGRNVEVTEELREQVHRRFSRVARQVPEPARLDIVLREERNPSIGEHALAEATLHLKGRTLHATESSRQMATAVNHVADDIKRQVKRHRELRRKRTRTRRPLARTQGRTA